VAILYPYGESDSATDDLAGPHDLAVVAAINVAPKVL
jgi:hypothetical protein